MGAAAGQPAKPDQFRRVRRSIARVKTVLNQKRAQGDGR
jgi:ribosomal protein L29